MVVILEVCEPPLQIAVMTLLVTSFLRLILHWTVHKEALKNINIDNLFLIASGHQIELKTLAWFLLLSDYESH